MEALHLLKARAEARWRERTDATRPRVEISTSSCSFHAGAAEVLKAAQEAVENRGIRVMQVGDTGMCWAEPVIFIARPGEARVAYGPVRAGEAAALIEDVLMRGERRVELALGVDDLPPTGPFGGTQRTSPLGLGQLGTISPFSQLPYFQVQRRRLVERCGVIDPEDIDGFLATGGYAALDKALAMAPDDIVKQLTDAKLTGRGGANFPAGTKWNFLKGASGHPKYMVCNADEGDPGAFVNRILMESDPHLIIEGMAIGAYVAGSTFGYIYIRDEYPLCVERVERALEQARTYGLLGERILGSDFSYDMQVVRGAGAYVCGEETGLIASIQDYRGMPRIKPPFPAQSGVFYKPSNVNNVETYACAPGIILNGMEWFASVGTERNKGTKLFSLSGRVNRVCIVEVDVGTPIRTVLEVCGGGVPQGHSLKGIQQGGPLGGLIPAAWLDTGLDPANFPPMGPEGVTGTLMGSGGMVFFDDRDCPIDLCKWALAFDQDESCGRCTSCRIGSMRMVDIMERITRGQGRAEDVETMQHLSGVMMNGNCVHGQFTPGPFASAYRFFKEEFDEHILEGRCRAMACRGLKEYVIEPTLVTGELADQLVAVCPVDAIVKEGTSARIAAARCIRCGLCREAVPQAVSVRTARTPLPERQAGVLARR